MKVEDLSKVTEISMVENRTRSDGAARSVFGQLRPQVMLVERVSNFEMRGGVPGDCCAYYLTDTITLDGRKIKRFYRSTFFNNELSIAGGSGSI